MKHKAITLSLGALIFAWSIATEAQDSNSRIAEQLRYWMHKKSVDHQYRAIVLRYVVLEPEWQATKPIPMARLEPAVMGLGAPQLAEDCNAQAKASISDTFDLNRLAFNIGDRLWVDWDEGVIGVQTEKGVVFERIVCLPMRLVDDLDRVGTEYQDVDIPGKVPQVIEISNSATPSPSAPMTPAAKSATTLRASFAASPTTASRPHCKPPTPNRARRGTARNGIPNSASSPWARPANSAKPQSRLRPVPL